MWEVRLPLGMSTFHVRTLVRVLAAPLQTQTPAMLSLEAADDGSSAWIAATYMREQQNSGFLASAYLALTVAGLCGASPRMGYMSLSLAFQVNEK